MSLAAFFFVSPGRKIDPGPLWDWDKFRAMVREVSEEPKVVLLSDPLPPTLIDCHARIEKGITRVGLRALCNALEIVPVPEVHTLQECDPHEDPPGTTRLAFRKFVEPRGWDVLTHKLDSQNKIYLRKRDPRFDENEDTED